MIFNSHHSYISKSRIRSYSFGFNGQEKDNEVYGEGNSYTAEFWQYDTRLGRRWNVDPVPQVSVSDYACFLNNPIFWVDLKGNTATDWIQNKTTKEVEWRDEVTSEANTPEGYDYVGKEDSDILKAFKLNNLPESDKQDKNFGYINGEQDGSTTTNWPVWAIANGSTNVTPIVTHKIVTEFVFQPGDGNEGAITPVKKVVHTFLGFAITTNVTLSILSGQSVKQGGDIYVTDNFSGDYKTTSSSLTLQRYELNGGSEYGQYTSIVTSNQVYQLARDKKMIYYKVEAKGTFWINDNGLQKGVIHHPLWPLLNYWSLKWTYSQ